jgi:hypothetical protein
MTSGRLASNLVGKTRELLGKKTLTTFVVFGQMLTLFEFVRSGG